MKLLYGMDPLCGWCFGIGPAIRRVVADHPTLSVQPVLAGLITGARTGPYADNAAYIRQASQRLHATTGRAPSQAFFDLIQRPGVMGDSGPPSVAIGALRLRHPDHALDFALRLTEAHFATGADLNDPATYHGVLHQMGLPLNLPDLSSPALAQTEWQAGRALGLRSFPSLWLQDNGPPVPVAVDYDPTGLSATIGRLIAP